MAWALHSSSCWRSERSTRTDSQRPRPLARLPACTDGRRLAYYYVRYGRFALDLVATLPFAYLIGILVVRVAGWDERAARSPGQRGGWRRDSAAPLVALWRRHEHALGFWGPCSLLCCQCLAAPPAHSVAQASDGKGYYAKVGPSRSRVRALLSSRGAFASPPCLGPCAYEARSRQPPHARLRRLCPSPSNVSGSGSTCWRSYACCGSCASSASARSGPSQPPHSRS
jgi:hypothetical protein